MDTKIFLSAERGVHQTEHYRSYHTFNFGHYFNVHKVAFDRLTGCNDDTLAADSEITLRVADAAYIILLPIVGTLAYSDTTGNKSMLNPGMVQLVQLHKQTIQLANRYAASLINYMWLQIVPDAEIAPGTICQLHFNLDENKNTLVPLDFGGTQLQLHIGKFAGREEAVYGPSHKSVFIYVIQGVFEVEGRLLHARDGLALWELTGTITLEALSNDAIILFIAH
jgi:redox-sensitive bicupin YhaK (pirin superfamily)